MPTGLRSRSCVLNANRGCPSADCSLPSHTDSAACGRRLRRGSALQLQVDPGVPSAASRSRAVCGAQTHALAGCDGACAPPLHRTSWSSSILSWPRSPRSPPKPAPIYVPVPILTLGNTGLHFGERRVCLRG
eukprot:1769491-Rhodomonas_salina.1